MFNTVCFIDSYKWLRVVLKLTELKLEPLCKIKFHFRRYNMDIVFANITCTFIFTHQLLILAHVLSINFFFNILRFLQTNVLNIALTWTVWLYDEMEPFISKNITFSSLIFVTPISYFYMLALWFCRWPLCIQTMTQSLSLVDFMAVYKQEWYLCQWKSPHLEE